MKRQYYEARLGYDIISNAFFWKITGPFRWTLDQLKKTLEGNVFAEGAWNALRWIYWRGNIPPAPGLPPADTDPVSEPGDSVTILCSLHTVFIARLIRHSLGLVSIRSDILTCEPAIYKSGLHIVVCPQMFRKLPEHYISFQMEQTRSSRWLTEEYMMSLEKSFAVLDYSRVNIRYFQLASEFSDKLYYTPVDYLPGLSRDAGPFEYDVVFYGDVRNERRRSALEKLGRHFKVKILSEVFGENLYKKLSRARVVVNIHYYDNSMLETTRLYETLSLGCSMIVSERSSDSDEEKRLEGIVDFVPNGDIDAMVERIAYWLSHEETRKDAVKKNNELLSQRASAFDFFFLRFLLANDWIMLQFPIR